MGQAHDVSNFNNHNTTTNTTTTNSQTMPSVSIAGALLSLYVDLPDELWTWSEWVEFVKMTSVPYVDAGAESRPAEWSDEVTEAVRQFAMTYKAKDSQQRSAFIVKPKKQDQYSLGREAWKLWANKHWRVVMKGNARVDQCFAENSFRLKDVLEEANSTKVSHEFSV